jgi:tape measure domain-containing protein
VAKPVKWDLIADPTRFNRGFREAERTSGRFQQHMRRQERQTVRFGTTLGSFGGVAVKAFGGATVAAGGFAVAGAVLGLKTAANLETAEVAFTRLLGSGKRARGFLGELKTFAAKTPFELPGLVNAARSLVGAGTAAKDVIPILTSLGDASGALGLDQERFGRVMIAVTQIMNRGKVQAEELNQITEAGIPVWTLLAKATGKPVPELQKLMQAGKLLAKDTLPLLFAQMRKDYGGGMVAQSKTLAGVWSTFKDTVSLTLSDALQPLLPVLKTALPQAGEVFQRSITGVTDFFRSDLTPELGRVRDAWEGNKSAILAFASSLTGSQGSMQSNADAARSLGDAMTQLVEATGSAARAGTAFADWLNRQKAGMDENAVAIHDKLIAPITSATRKFGEFFGLRPIGPLQGVAEHLTSTTAQLATNTSTAASAAQRHATAMREQKAAMDALTGALDTEKGAELNLRQAKLNVATAQGRLNELKKAGKTRSTEYKQAQLNLERAHLAAKEASGQYRAAVNRSNEAERLAASRATATSAALRTLQATSIGARKRLVQFALDSSAAIQKLRGKTLKVTANYNIGAPKGIELLIEKGLVRATGGPIAGPGTATSDSVPTWLSTGEHVWSAKEVKGAGGHRAVEQMRKRARGMAAGGPVLDFRQTGTAAFLRRPDRFDANIARSLAAAARGFGALVRQNKESIFGVGKAAVKAFIRSTDPLPYVWGGAGPGGYDCSGLVSAVLGKHTGRGGGHGQRYFTTSSIGAGILGLKPGLGGTLQIGVTAGTGHMAGRYGGLGFEARSTRSGIIVGSGARSPGSFARQFHLAKGGHLDPDMVARFAQLTGLDVGGDAGRLRIDGKVLDQGGWLMPGQVGANRGSRPERVLSPRERIPTATEIAKALAAELRANPPIVRVDDVHAGLLRKRSRNGGMVLGLD